MYPVIITKAYRTNYIKNQFNEFVGYDLNLSNSQLFNEKLQWYKLNYWDKHMAICADKFEVRSYVKSLLLDGILILLTGNGIYNSIEEIDFDLLTNRSVLKTTNGSGTNVICTIN